MQRPPEDGLRLFADQLPAMGPDDLRTICQPLDFYGANIYSGKSGVAGEDGCWQPVRRPDGYALTAMEWPVTPDVLYWGPRFLHERYGLPVVVTENGMANCDWVHLDGRVHDPQRIDFLSRYLRAYGRAIGEGLPALGYIVWSVMDNFEWSFGYKRRFGLIHVDYATGARTPKDSAHWYRQVIASNGGIVEQN
ncbi:MAG: family 1 glycosylhydrolase [Candidatus Latescibacterota bacterium]